MDPTENLRALRALRARIDRGEHLDTDEQYRLSHLLGALDQWLSQGGFPPASWVSIKHQTTVIEIRNALAKDRKNTPLAGVSVAHAEFRAVVDRAIAKSEGL